MASKPTDRADELIDEIRDLRAGVWSGAAAIASEADAHQRLMLEAMRKLSVELLHRGVTTAVMEGAYLMWWLRVSCVNHRFGEGGFERSLGRIGPLVGPISKIIMRLGEEIEDDGPLPEMQLLGEKIEELRGMHGGAVVTTPKSRDEEDAQTEIAHELIQQTILVTADVGIPPTVIESLLLYFWFRCTANRYGVREAFFQKIERNWSVVMDHVSRYMDEQAATDRRSVGGHGPRRRK
jgi:hypothetical protein